MEERWDYDHYIVPPARESVAHALTHHDVALRFEQYGRTAFWFIVKGHEGKGLLTRHNPWVILMGTTLAGTRLTIHLKYTDPVGRASASATAEIIREHVPVTASG